MDHKKRFIIDTDAGIDDAQAILIALNSPDVEVVAITTCQGNTNVEQVCRNVLRLLKVANRLEIPVYRGCDKPILGKTVAAAHYHGIDGFGDVPDPDAPDITLTQSEHAVPALVRLVNEHKGELTLVALAPCTNIALALRLDPEMGNKLKNCYMMGGNYEGKGNITPSAEFNFYSDPEAADVVLQEIGCPLYLVCWELCLKQSLPWAWYEEFLSPKTKCSHFLREIEEKTIRNYYNDKHEETCYITADQIAMAIAIEPAVIEKIRGHLSGIVETESIRFRGMLITDGNRPTLVEQERGGSNSTRHNINIVTALCQDKYEDMLMRATK